MAAKSAESVDVGPIARPLAVKCIGALIEAASFVEERFRAVRVDLRGAAEAA
jgi:hypothetical protein